MIFLNEIGITVIGIECLFLFMKYFIVTDGKMQFSAKYAQQEVSDGAIIFNESDTFENLFINFGADNNFLANWLVEQFQL